MAIMNFIKGQLRSVIQWENPNPTELFALWSERGDEIKNASKLIVGPGQGCIFVYEGKVQAVHTEEGLYELKTANIPFLTTLSKFMQAFESEHKVGIFFFWRTEFLNQKWGTVAPIKYTDPVYKFPVGLRAFGNFTFRLETPDAFFTNIVGGRPSFSVDDARMTIVQRFTQQLTDILATSSFGYTEIDRNREELAAQLTEAVRGDFQKLGFSMSDFRIENTDFDEDTVRRIGRIADTIAEAEAARAAGLNYAQMQQLEALREAARNEGGAAGAGVSLGAGVGLGQALMGSLQQPAQTPNDPVARMKKLDELRAQNLISQEEYDKKKAEILSAL